MSALRVRPYLLGGGRLEALPDGYRLHLGPARGYADAQLDDTHGLPRARLAHRPPVRLSLEARASALSPGGTLGFGFWNDPFPSWAGEAGAGRLFLVSPRTLWFFHASPPSDLPFSPGGPGSGWTASTLVGPRLPGLAITPLGVAAAGGMMVRALRPLVMRAYWRWMRGVQSPPLGGLDEWHRYEIDWEVRQARLSVDGRVVLEGPSPPGPLGLVIWIDNQWAAFSRTAGLRFGVLPSLPPAWLEIRGCHLNEDEVAVVAHD